MVEKNKKGSSSEELKKKFRESEKMRDEYLAGWQRSRADFLNYQKQEMEKIEGLVNYALTELILKILPIFDNLQRAKKHIPKNLEDSDWARGILQIETQFGNFLKEQGIEEIKALGKEFNPDFHQAVEEVKIEGKKSGTIVEVLRKGYLRKKTLLRPAKVKMAK